MRFPSFTRRESWMYGTLLTVLCGAGVVTIPVIQRQLFVKGIRSKIHVGQSMSQVLAAIEEEVAARPNLPLFTTYSMHAFCEDRSWALVREPGPDGRAGFHVLGPSGLSEPSPASTITEREPFARDQVSRFAEANVNGCTVSVSAGRLDFTIGNDGKVTALEPPAPTELRDWTWWLPLRE